MQICFHNPEGIHLPTQPLATRFSRSLNFHRVIHEHFIAYAYMISRQERYLLAPPRRLSSLSNEKNMEILLEMFFFLAQRAGRKVPYLILKILFLQGAEKKTKTNLMLIRFSKLRIR